MMPSAREGRRWSISRCTVHFRSSARECAGCPAALIDVAVCRQTALLVKEACDWWKQPRVPTHLSTR